MDMLYAYRFRHAMLMKMSLANSVPRALMDSDGIWMDRNRSLFPHPVHEKHFNVKGNIAKWINDRYLALS